MEDKEVLREKYFLEIDPEIRREILDKYAETQPDEASLLRNLWTQRYTDPKRPKQRVDNFLWQIINLISLFRVSRFFSFGTNKEIDDAMAHLCFSEAAKYGGMGRDTLYQEFRNAARRYFSTCDHKSYAKKTLGLMTMGENERKNKTAREVWQLTVGLPQRYQTDENMAMFCKAVNDQYLAEFSDGEERLAEQNKKYGKK